MLWENKYKSIIKEKASKTIDQVGESAWGKVNSLIGRYGVD